MNSMTTRLGVAAALILAAIGITHLVRASTAPPEVEMPNWTFEQMPRQLGEWHGEDSKLDDKLTAAIGAEIIVDRSYRDERGRAVSLHTAMFKNPTEGVYHSPINCYRSGGWEFKGEDRVEVSISEDRSIPVAVTKWEKEGERVLVIFWYQIGDHVMLNRFELGEARWALRGLPKWPPIVKVMIQIPAPDVDDAKAIGLAFAELVAKWENQPSHRISPADSCQQINRRVV